jgi:pyridoxine/pyridoxamine 5'-phosphate oxidase
MTPGGLTRSGVPVLRVVLLELGRRRVVVLTEIEARKASQAAQ